MYMYMQHVIYMKEKNFREFTEYTKVKLTFVLGCAKVVLGAAAQKGCLHYCETANTAFYFKEETYFLQQGL